MQPIVRNSDERKPVRKKPLISIVVPMWNEAESLPFLYKSLTTVTKRLAKREGYRFEYIFVDDGSTDNSVEIITALARQSSEVRIIEFSRNFGKEIAVTAGIHAAQGDAVIMLDADLQHPVELLPEFLQKWRAGAEVVVGVRRHYGRQSVWKRFTSWLFYKSLAKISHTVIVPGATDYRLIDKQVVAAFNQLSEHNRMTRGLIDWLGFRREYIYFTPEPRHYGQAGYSFNKLLGLAVNSFVSLSLFPLRLAGYLGIFITATAGLGGLFIVVEDFMLDDPLNLKFSGPAMLAVLNMFWIGIVLSALGLVALYIASIHTEVINRPLYITRARPRPTTAKPLKK